MATPSQQIFNPRTTEHLKAEQAVALSDIPKFMEAMGGTVLKHKVEAPEMRRRISVPAISGNLMEVVTALNALNTVRFNTVVAEVTTAITATLSAAADRMESLLLTSIPEALGMIEEAALRKDYSAKLNTTGQALSERVETLLRDTVPALSAKATALSAQISKDGSNLSDATRAAIRQLAVDFAALDTQLLDIAKQSETLFKTDAVALCHSLNTANPGKYVNAIKGLQSAYKGDGAELQKILTTKAMDASLETLRTLPEQPSLPTITISAGKESVAGEHLIKLPAFNGKISRYLDIMSLQTNANITMDNGVAVLGEALKAKQSTKVENYLIRGIPGIGKTEYFRDATYKMSKRHGLEVMDVRDAAARLESDPNWLPDDNQACLFYTSMADAGSMDIGGMLTTSEKTLDDGRVIPLEEHIPPRFWQVAALFKNAFYILDEINTIRLTTPLLSLLTVGVYQNTRLAENAVVVGIANYGKEDNTTPLNFTSADINRWCVLNTYQTTEDWIRDFGAANVHPAAVTFLRQSDVAERFESYMKPKAGSTIQHNISTLRSLTELSKKLYNLEDTLGGNDSIFQEEGSVSESKAKSILSEADKVKMVRVAAYAHLGPELQDNFASWYLDAYATCAVRATAILQSPGAVSDPARLQDMTNFRSTYFSISASDVSSSSGADDLEKRTKNFTLGENFLTVLPAFAVRYMYTYSQKLTNAKGEAYTDKDRMAIISHFARATLEAAFFLTSKKQKNNDAKNDVQKVTQLFYVMDEYIKGYPELVAYLDKHADNSMKNVQAFLYQQLVTLGEHSKNPEVQAYASAFLKEWTAHNKTNKEIASSLGVNI